MPTGGFDPLGFDPSGFDTDTGGAAEPESTPTASGPMLSDSANDFVTKALRGLNVIDAITDPAPEMLASGRDILEEMIDAWAIEKRIIYYVAPNQHALVSGQASYTIGVGGQFDQVRPVWLSRWSLIPDRTATPLLTLDRGRLWTEDEWAAISAKGTTGSYPMGLYYDHKFVNGLGTVFVYPVPDRSTVDIILWSPTPLAGFPDATTKVAFPPGYHRALRYGLMEELAIDYPGALTEEISRRAIDAKAKVKRANYRMKEASFDRALVGSRGGRRYNIYTDDY